VNHDVHNDSQRNNKPEKQEDDFSSGYPTDVYLNVPHDEEARYQNKTVEGY
jgi:hypothetical protein